jgi:hypothetical protein
MAKITRKAQSIFAYNSGVATNVVAQFGSLKAAAITYSQDPDTIQGLTAWQGGLADAVISNYSPAIQDLNSLFFLLSRQIAYALQAGIPEWDATTPYYIGSLVSDGVGGIYMSISDTNVNQAVTVVTKWVCYRSLKITSIGASYTVLGDDWLIVWDQGSGPTEANHTVTLPTPTTAMKGREVIVKLLQSSYVWNLHVDVTAGHIDVATDYTAISQYQAKRFVCDGSTWNLAGYYPAT